MSDAFWPAATDDCLRGTGLDPLRWDVPFPHERINHYQPVDLLLAILYTMVAGLPRLSKTRILQYNGAFQRLVGLRGFPHPSRLTRWLRQWSEIELEGLLKVHEWQPSTLGTLRTRLLVLPARLVRSGHRNVLKLPVGYQHQRQFQQTLTRIERLHIE